MEISQDGIFRDIVLAMTARANCGLYLSARTIEQVFSE